MKGKKFCEECGGLGAFEVWYGENWEYMTMLPCAKCDGWKLWWKEKPKKFWTREEILKNPKLKLKDPFGRDWKKEVGEKKKEEAVEERREVVAEKKKEGMAEKQKKEEEVEREVKTENWRKSEELKKSAKEGRKERVSSKEVKEELTELEEAVLKALVGKSFPQVGMEICVTLEKLRKAVRPIRDGKKGISKPTLIKGLNGLCRKNYISKQVYVLSRGRGTIKKIATYVLLEKAIIFLTGLGKFTEKVKIAVREVGRRIKRWMEKKKEELEHLGKHGVNIKTWLTKQGFKLFKCTHPWIFYTMGPG